jgi:hypothetical protein
MGRRPGEMRNFRPEFRRFTGIAKLAEFEIFHSATGNRANSARQPLSVEIAILDSATGMGVNWAKQSLSA